MGEESGWMSPLKGGSCSTHAPRRSKVHRIPERAIHSIIIMGIFDYSITYRYFVDGEIREEVLTGHVDTKTVLDRLGDLFSHQSLCEASSVYE